MSIDPPPALPPRSRLGGDVGSQPPRRPEDTAVAERVAATVRRGYRNSLTGPRLLEASHLLAIDRGRCRRLPPEGAIQARGHGCRLPAWHPFRHKVDEPVRRSSCRDRQPRPNTNDAVAPRALQTRRSRTLLWGDSCECEFDDQTENAKSMRGNLCEASEGEVPPRKITELPNDMIEKLKLFHKRWE